MKTCLDICFPDPRELFPRLFMDGYHRRYCARVQNENIGAQFFQHLRGDKWICDIGDSCLNTLKFLLELVKPLIISCHCPDLGTFGCKAFNNGTSKPLAATRDK